MNKQKLIGTDHSVAIIRGNRVRGSKGLKGVYYMVMEEELTWVDGHTFDAMNRSCIIEVCT